MPSHRHLRIASRGAAALLAVALAAGCARPLAVQHEYFAPASGSIDRASVVTQHLVSHYRALQTAQRWCAVAAGSASVPPAGAEIPEGRTSATRPPARRSIASARPSAPARGGRLRPPVRSVPALGGGPGARAAVGLRDRGLRRRRLLNPRRPAPASGSPTPPWPRLPAASTHGASPRTRRPNGRCGRGSRAARRECSAAASPPRCAPSPPSPPRAWCSSTSTGCPSPRRPRGSSPRCARSGPR